MRVLMLLMMALTCVILNIASVPPSPRRPLAPRYTVTDLGTLGGSESGAYALNNNGQVVGWADKGGNSGNLLHTDAFLWEDGKMRALELASNERFCPAAFAINDRGQILIHSEPHARGLAALDMQVPSYALLWDSGKVTEFGTFSPKTLNNKGQVVGGATPKGSSSSQPAIWEVEKVRYIVPPAQSTNAYGHAINDRGEIAGMWSSKNVPRRAFLFRNDRLLSLPTPKGCESAEAFCINNKGQAVVWAWTDNGHAAAYLWQPSTDARSGKAESEGKLIYLGGADEGDHWAYALNNTGQVVGCSSGRAFLWGESEMTDLNRLIAPDSGWVLHEARGINDKGQICGTGLHNGERRAFLLTPIAK